MSELTAETLQTLHYDALDRIQQIRIGSTTEGQRFYRHSELVNQQMTGTTIAYLREANSLLAVVKNNTANITGTDQQGSVVLTNGSTPAPQSSYTAHGFNPTPDLLGYCGEAADPITGCYLLGNGYRAYDPVAMRFRSPDSFSPFGAGGINPYAYCGADPINRSDPTGHLDWIGWVNIGFTVLGFAMTLYSAQAALPAFAKLTSTLTGGALGATRGAVATASSVVAAASVTMGTTSTVIQIAGASIFGTSNGDADKIQLARYLGIASGALSLLSTAAGFARLKLAAKEAAKAQRPPLSPLGSFNRAPVATGRVANTRSRSSLPESWSPASPSAPGGRQAHELVIAPFATPGHRAAAQVLAMENPATDTQTIAVELRSLRSPTWNKRSWVDLFDQVVASQA